MPSPIQPVGPYNPVDRRLPWLNAPAPPGGRPPVPGPRPQPQPAPRPQPPRPRPLPRPAPAPQPAPRPLPRPNPQPGPRPTPGPGGVGGFVGDVLAGGRDQIGDRFNQIVNPIDTVKGGLGSFTAPYEGGSTGETVGRLAVDALALFGVAALFGLRGGGAARVGTKGLLGGVVDLTAGVIGGIYRAIDGVVGGLFGALGGAARVGTR